MRRDPLERLDVRVHDALDDALVLSDPVRPHVDRDEGVVAAESGARRLRWAEVDEDLGVTAFDETRNRRLGRHAGIDRPLLDGGDERVARADGDRGELIRRDALRAREVLRETVRAG